MRTKKMQRAGENIENEGSYAKGNAVASQSLYWDFIAVDIKNANSLPAANKFSPIPASAAQWIISLLSVKTCLLSPLFPYFP